MKLRPRLTYSNVASTLCLFLLVGGGTALAAGKLSKNSVSSKQLKANSVTTPKIRNKAVTGAKVKTSTLGTVPNAANAASAATLGGQPPSAFQQRVRWALVGEDGEILEQSGGITNTHDPSDCHPGCDFLNFGSPQTGKAITVSSAAPAFGLYIVGVCGGEGNPDGTHCDAGTPESADDTSHILVESASITGASADRSYYITVTG